MAASKSKLRRHICSRLAVLRELSGGYPYIRLMYGLHGGNYSLEIPLDSVRRWRQPQVGTTNLQSSLVFACFSLQPAKKQISGSTKPQGRALLLKPAHSVSGHSPAGCREPQQQHHGHLFQAAGRLSW